jgi:hypothetical protein
MTYPFMADFSASYALCCRMLALRHGSVRAATCWEFYWCEGQGLIP